MYWGLSGRRWSWWSRCWWLAICRQCFLICRFLHIKRLFGGRVTEVLQCVYSTVNDFFSVFLVVATSVSYSIIKQKKQGIYEGTGNIIILVIISLAAFIKRKAIIVVLRKSWMYVNSALSDNKCICRKDLFKVYINDKKWHLESES